MTALPMHGALLADPLELGLGDLNEVRLPSPDHPANTSWLQAVHRETGRVPRVLELDPSGAKELARRLRERVGTLGTPRVIGIGGAAGTGRTSIVRALGEIAARLGVSVAALDCDLNHPALLPLFGVSAPPILLDELVLTHIAHGVRIQSLAAFWPTGDALPWQGRELERVLNRYREDVLWGHPDLLLLDLPAIPDQRSATVLKLFSAELWQVDGPTVTACAHGNPVFHVSNAVPQGHAGVPYLPAGEFFETLRTRLEGLLPSSWTNGLASST